MHPALTPLWTDPSGIVDTGWALRTPQESPCPRPKPGEHELDRMLLSGQHMPGTCPHTQARLYCRHEPEKHPLYQILAQPLETFLQRSRTAEHQLPGHVEEELRAYLKCGILAHGFVRLRCADCGSPRDLTITGAPLPPPPGPSLLFFRGIEVQMLKCVFGA